MLISRTPALCTDSLCMGSHEALRCENIRSWFGAERISNEMVYHPICIHSIGVCEINSHRNLVPHVSKPTGSKPPKTTPKTSPRGGFGGGFGWCVICVWGVLGPVGTPPTNVCTDIFVVAIKESPVTTEQRLGEIMETHTRRQTVKHTTLFSVHRECNQEPRCNH